MANKIQIKRGAASKLPTLDVGEPGFTTDTKRLYIGSSSGNVAIANKSEVDEVDSKANAKQAKFRALTATLSVSGWASNTQQVSIQNLQPSDLVQVAPAPAAVDAYAAAGIICTEQAEGKLTFTCKTVPTESINVHVVVWSI